MKIIWHGTAALTLSCGGVTLAVDPFIGMPVGMSGGERLNSQRADALRKADAVLATHGHFDHIYDIPALYAGSATPVYATKTPVTTLTEKGVKPDRLYTLTPGQSIVIGSFCVTAYQSRHCTFDLAVILKTVFRKAAVRHPKRLFDLLRLNRDYPENGETLFYEITADGKRLQIMGSMGMADGADYPTGADLLILPFQGTGNPAATVRPIVDRLKPKRILLDHYDDAFPPLSAQIATERFEREMCEKGIPCRAMRAGKVYEI